MARWSTAQRGHGPRARPMPVSRPPRPRRASDHAAVRPPRLRMGQRHRPRSAEVRHAFDEEDKGNPDLSADREPQSCATFVGAPKKLSRPCAISASRSTTRLRSPRKPTSEKQRVAVSCNREHGVPPAFLARPRPTGALRPAPKAPSDRARSANYAAVNAPLCYRKVRGQTREGAAMPEPRERIARALSRLQGHPSDIRFEGKPMWHSFLPEADAALAAADIDPLIALLRQIEADVRLTRRHRSRRSTSSKYRSRQRRHGLRR